MTGSVDPLLGVLATVGVRYLVSREPLLEDLAALLICRWWAAAGTGIGGLLLGLVSEHCVRHAGRPVG